MTRKDLITAIAGKEVDTQVSSQPVVFSDEQPLLEVRALQQHPLVHDVSFALRPHEVLGLAGLIGAGRTEVARMIFGAERPEAGEIILNGQPLRLKGTFDGIKHGIGLVPEERRSQGLVLTSSIMFNINLSYLKRMRLVSWFPLINMKRGATKATKLTSDLSIKTRNINTQVSQLSGGNQQKVVIGKWLEKDIRLLILDEPTRGVDIGARTEIHRLIRNLAAEGTGILVISSDFEELPGLCDRVVVMAEGYVTGELVGHEITRDAILQLSYAHKNGVGK